MSWPRLSSDARRSGPDARRARSIPRSARDLRRTACRRCIRRDRPDRCTCGPVSGCVRTIGWSTGGLARRCSSVIGSSPWRRVREKSRLCTARRFAMRAFHVGVETLVRAVHVAEVRLAADVGHDLAVNDRRLAGDARPRAVGVPLERTLVRDACRWACRSRPGSTVDRAPDSRPRDTGSSRGSALRRSCRANATWRPGGSVLRRETAAPGSAGMRGRWR